nr:hypothetical protein [Tanacetum cinerariifolium]
MEQVKEQVKAQVSKILPKIEKTVNEQLKAEVLTRSSKASYVVAASLSELELKKIIIEKMESNKLIHISDEQKNLYKALVDAYECDKLILDTYGDTVTLKRRRDDEDKDEESSARSNRGSKRRRAGKEPKSTSAPNICDESAQVDTLTPELLVGLTYELMKGSCKSLVELEFFLEEVYKATTDQLDWNNPKDLVPRTIWSQVPISYDKHALWGISHWGRKRQQFYGFAVNMESARDVYSKHRIIAVTELQIIEWHNYKHLDWITNKDKQNRLMRIDELYKFSDGTLNDVRTALDDRLKGIQMQYLPQTIWRRSDKDRAATMIQAIDKQLKTRRIMRSLEKFIVQTDEPNLSATTTIVEVPKELPTVSMGTWGFEHTKACFRDDIIPFVKALKELFTSFDQCLLDEVTEVQNVFKQMELAVVQHRSSKGNSDLQLKEKLRSLKGDVTERNVKREVEEIETLNIELDHKVTKLVAENKHLKQTYKQLYDSVKSSRVQSKEQCDDLINKVNLKSAEVSDLNASLQEKVLMITALKE